MLKYYDCALLSAGAIVIRPLRHSATCHSQKELRSEPRMTTTVNTAALIRSNSLRRAYEPTSIQKQHPWIAKYCPDPSPILEFDRLMFRKASFMPDDASSQISWCTGVVPDLPLAPPHRDVDRFLVDIHPYEHATVPHDLPPLVCGVVRSVRYSASSPTSRGVGQPGRPVGLSTMSRIRPPQSRPPQ
jgi:hypothetical protein